MVGVDERYGIVGCDAQQLLLKGDILKAPG